MHKITPESIVYEVLKMLSGSGEISPKLFHFGQTRYDTYNWQIRQMEKAQDYITPDGTKFEHLKFVNRSGGGGTHIPKTIRLSKEYPFIYASVGAHPDEIGILNDEWMEKMSSASLTKTFLMS